MRPTDVPPRVKTDAEHEPVNRSLTRDVY